MIQEYINKIINADCLEIMKKLPDKSIDLLLTDPPYGLNKKLHGGKNAKMCFNEVNEKGWDFVPDEEYFNEMFRVSKSQIIWGGNYFSLPPSRCWICWDKLLPESFSLGMAEFAYTSFDRRALIYRMASEKSDRLHPTQKPLQLFQKCLNEFSKEGDLILDCFSGSGTTAVACWKTKRNFICIEKDAEYYEKSLKRLEDEQRQGVLL